MGRVAPGMQWDALQQPLMFRGLFIRSAGSNLGFRNLAQLPRLLPTPAIYQPASKSSRALFCSLQD